MALFIVSEAPELMVKTPELSNNSQKVISSVMVKFPLMIAFFVSSGVLLLQEVPFQMVNDGHSPLHTFIKVDSSEQFSALPEIVLAPEPCRYAHKLGKLQIERLVLLTICNPYPSDIKT